MIAEYILLGALSAYLLGAIALFTHLIVRDTLSCRIGIVAAIGGTIAAFANLIARDVTTGIWPLTNLYGSLTLFGAMSVVLFLCFAARYRLWFLGGPIQLAAAMIIAYALSWNEGAIPAVPALQSYWIKIHVPLVVSAYAAFLVAATLSALTLIKIAYTQRERNLPSWLAALPTLVQLDILTYRIIGVGLPLLTIGIITGAWWAKEAWGAYWQWDPKETAALLSWIIYASYLHLHTRRAWQGARSAWLSLLGFASILFCYLGVNLWISGLHSYVS